MPRIILKNTKGRDGKDGVQGPQGPAGPSGIQGDEGRAGLRGDQGEQGPQGPSGERGSQGLSGAQGGIGSKGEQGAQGEQGDKGDSPEHKWSGESLQFQNPDGTWGKSINLRGEHGSDRGFVGGGPSSAGIQYTQIITSTYIVQERKLIKGHNIFGVDFNGSVQITIPDDLSPEKLIVVKDESGSAGLNVITIKAA